MQSLQRNLRSLLIGFMIVAQIFLPVAALAQETTVSDPAEPTSQSAESTTEETPPAQEQPPAATSTTQPEQQPTTQSEAPAAQKTTGPTKPTGADSGTYTYNKQTGLWENEHYTWDPVTKQTKPKNAQTYSYNPESGRWDTTTWYYSPESGRYEPNTVSVARPPAAAGSSISNTGPNSNNTIDSNNNTSGTFDLFFDVSVSNKIGQLAQSGNASVLGNLSAGNALTGDTQSIANVLNMLQSSWGTLGSGDVSSFVANIDGNVVGDLFIDPNQFPAGTGGNSDIDINVAYNGLIDNDIDVVAQSGNARVSNNTTGGNATSGDAMALVNLINLMNSAISANRSFVGTLNINGNLDGDILLPPALLQAIIASTGPNSNNTINNQNNTNLDVDIDTNRTIVNDVEATAGTGNATVANNTNAGSATTGNAESNVRLLNLTGHRVVASNALVVFVNVLGSWVGLIMDAPAGTNAVAVTGPNSNNTINSSNNTDVELDVTENSRIQNNVRARAQSGDAEVSSNTTGGNATSGDATANVNILNMIDSDLALTDWFGVLFINVFGSWNGSFGVNTDAGNSPASTGAMGVGQAPVTAATASPAARIGQVFGFNSATSTNSGNSNSSDSTPPSGTAATAGLQTQSTGASGTTSNVASTPATQTAKSSNLFLQPILYVILLGTALVVAMRRLGWGAR